MSYLKLWATALIILVLPTFVCRPLLRILGHRVGKGVKIGFSVILARRLVLQSTVHIGHFNVLKLNRLVMRHGAYLGRGNLIHGPLSILLAEKAAIGNNNKIVRASIGSITTGPACLWLGQLSKITANHRVDCTKSIHLGNYSTIAGTSCQLWTHGYVHDQIGPGRYRIDGSIKIGDNVYIGSSCIINAGINIANGVMIGAGTTVARSLHTPALYVSAGLRCLELPKNPDLRNDLELIDDGELCERVYLKRPLR